MADNVNDTVRRRHSAIQATPAAPAQNHDKASINDPLLHPQQAIDMRRSIKQTEIELLALQAAFERSGMAILVLSNKGRILFASPGADAILREADAIRAVNGCLRPVSRSTAERLTALVCGATGTGAAYGCPVGGALTIERASRRPLTVLVAPLRSVRGNFGASIPAAILFIKDPELSTLAVGTLQEMFGLTGAEAALAKELAAGKSIEDIATARRIRLSTARTQLKAIFAKTATNRQAQLVAMLSRTVAA
jgi:DNA-binding CsgD family transcriptional regulator